MDLFLVIEQCLYNYLSVIDLVQLYRVGGNARIRLLIFWTFKRALYMELRRKHSRAYLLLDHLNKHTILSGSFILKCLLSTSCTATLNWDWNDVDVYTHTKTPEHEGSCGEHCPHGFEQHHWKCSNCQVFNGKGFTHLGDFMCTTFCGDMNADTRDSSDNPRVDSIDDYDFLPVLSRKWYIGGTLSDCKNHIAINEIIIPKTSDVQKFITDSFDFGFCASTFDGTYLKIYDFESVFSKSHFMKFHCVIDHYGKLPSSTINKIARHVQNTFDYDIDGNSCTSNVDLKHKHVHTMCYHTVCYLEHIRTFNIRIPKYRARDFKFNFCESTNCEINDIMRWPDDYETICGKLLMMW